MTRNKSLDGYEGGVGLFQCSRLRERGEWGERGWGGEKQVRKWQRGGKDTPNRRSAEGAEEGTGG